MAAGGEGLVLDRARDISESVFGFARRDYDYENMCCHIAA